MKRLLKKFSFVIVFTLILSLVLCGCAPTNQQGGSGSEGGNSGDNGSSQSQSNNTQVVDNNNVEQIEVDEASHNYKLTSSDSGTYIFTCEDADCKEQITMSVVCDSGTSCVTVSDNTITFGSILEDTVYAISGEFYGNIVIDVGDDYAFELSLTGFSLTSTSEVPIYIKSGDEVTISAKKATENFIYDLREEVAEEGTSASIYSKVDLSIQGKGSLFVKSSDNNGIHTKDNLTVKNLTLQVECNDNALKGNDGVKIESGNITLIACCGDGIKTTNSHVSSKGKQKGDVKIQGGNLLIYSACDGIDSAHDVIVNESESTVNIQVFTDKYSKYSQTVTAVENDILYVRYSSTAYKYSLEYSNDIDTVWYNSNTYKSVNAGMGGNYYYYSITKPSGYNKVRLFIYSSTQSQGQSESYVACTDYLTINSNYDTLALLNRSGTLSYGWTNYTTSNIGGGMGGMQQEGNTDKGDYSTKGIKADNEIDISAGSITINSYDDAIHTNNDVELGEEGAYYYGTGNIVISGGTITLYSNDDGIHADGSLSITNGSVSITHSYEGLEGYTINIGGGDVSVISSDDGFNSTSTSGTGIAISGGTIYVYAGGDGLDSNSRTSYSGIDISGGKSVVISTGNADSSLDTESGYKYSGGYVVAIGRSGGMNDSESKHCSNFSSVGTSKSISLTKDNYLVVNEIATVKMPASISATVVVLGSNNASISFTNSFSGEMDNNGVSWNK